MNQKKLEEYSRVLDDGVIVLHRDTILWKQFLQFAVQFTHYRFQDQLLIYAQNQQATACATFAQWKKIGRYVKSGEHGIVLVDKAGDRPHLRHVFDVSSTGPKQEFAYKPQPVLPEEREELAKRLSFEYARENAAYLPDKDVTNASLEHILSQIALYMTQEYYNLSPDQAADRTENKEIPAYYVATGTSAMYMLLVKYGFGKEAEQLDFSCMVQLDTETFKNVGIAASAILSRAARMIRSIHPQVQKEVQAQKEIQAQKERSSTYDNGRYSTEDHVSSGRRLYDTRHRTVEGRGRDAQTEKVRDDEKALLGGERTSFVREDGDGRNTISKDEGSGRNGRSDQRADDAEAETADGSDGRTEEVESVGVGTQDGSVQPSGGGSDSVRVGIRQLTISDYLERNPADRGSEYIPDILKTEEQEKVQIESEQAVEETSAAFSITENERNQVLQLESVQEPAANFHITDEHLGEGGAKEKFRANIAAIRTLKKLETENRNATPQEQEILSKYIGWGGLADAFDDKKDVWADEYRELKEVLTENEYTAARESTLNAHYTSPTIIHGIYNALEQLGFGGGSILEPSMGIGNFFGMLPKSMETSRLYGVELDYVSGHIAQKLYPQANITVAGFETTNQHDFYDLAIGNVPFGNYKVNDRAYNRFGFSIHNYFFAKSLDQVRPGGIVAFITSHYTMDSKNSSARRYLAQRAQLLGAIRLPDNAFRVNAGAQVVTDIIFLKKREYIADVEEEWINLKTANNGYEINSYFVNHPEMILGTLEEQSTQFGMECTVKAYTDRKLSESLSDAISHIHGHYEPILQQKNEEDKEVKILPADPTVRNYTYAWIENDIYYRENSVMRKIELNAGSTERMKGLLEIRETLNDVIQRQIDGAPDEEIRNLQKKLEVVYDGFSKKFGLINDKQNARMLEGDSSYFLLCSLENLDENGKLQSKADIFTKRTIRARKAAVSAETPADALAISIGEKGHVDLTYMAELLGKKRQENETAKSLKGIIFRDPQEKDKTIAWKTADEYLSGDVRSKLRIAKMAASKDPEYETNVEALQAAQPKDLTASEIDVRLGATWIEQEYIEEFMYETFHTPYYLRRRITVTFVAATGEWRISEKNSISYNDVNAYTQYGTERMNAYAILEQTLNLRSVTVYDRITDAEGTTRSVVNPKETMLAQQKQTAIKAAFAGWIWKDPKRRMSLEQKYNERFNSFRPAEFSGNHIQFVGMNPMIGLRTHQKNAIAHILYGGNTLLAHEVGAGKTYTMAAAAMESKRLGLCQKSLFVVPNHLILQWANEFQYLYPAANLLIATKKDFETTNRKKFCARIATGDYDAVIIGHSQFERIPVSAERQERLLQNQMDEIESAIQEFARERGQSFTIKQLEKTRKNLKLKLEKLRAQERKDDVVTFEQLGVDRLFVDEAHAYKNRAKRCRTRQD